MATVSIRISGYTGQSGLTLWIYNSAGALVNTGDGGGDSLTETADSRGLFTADVDEALSGIYDVVITNSGGAVVFESMQGLDTDVSNLVGDSPSRSLLSTISSAVAAIATTVATVSGLTTAIKAVTDLFTFNGANDVHATLDGETVSGGGLTEDQATELTAIYNKTSLITSAGVDVVSPVSSSGTITIYRGDDYVAGNSNTISVLVSDADEAIKDYLQSADVDSVIFGAGIGSQNNGITGTVDPDQITHDAGTTTIPVAIAAAATAAAEISDDYEYHIKAIEVEGTDTEERTMVSGCLRLWPERARYTS